MIMAKVLIVGASNRPERYSYKALTMLKDHGHDLFLQSPKYTNIEGQLVQKELSEIQTSVDVLTLYVNPQISDKMKDDILRLRPKLVIFNPGTENASLMEALESQNIKILEACTLVLLSTGQFDQQIPAS